MSPFTEHDLSASRRPCLVDESPRSTLPAVWQVLCAVYDTRLQRAAVNLEQAKRNVHQACADERRAQTDWARLQTRADDFEREWHRAWTHREAQGRDLHGARATRARFEALLANQTQEIRIYAQTALRALHAHHLAQQRYRVIARKKEKLRALQQRLDATDHA